MVADDQRGMMAHMIKKLKELIERAETWPEADQAELAEHAEEIEGRQGSVHRLTDDEREGIERGLKAMREGRFASEERVSAIFRKARTPRT